MRNLRRLIALLLAGSMMFVMAGCDDNEEPDRPKMGDYEEVAIDGITYHKALDVTTDKITLSYYHYGDNEMAEYMADRFESIYPNITVNVICEDEATYMDKLMEYEENYEMPDVFMYSDCELVFEEILLNDISRFYNEDSETQNLLDTINSCALGCYGTSLRLGVPANFYPGIMYVDRNVVDKLGQKLPTQDWTWAEMMDLIKNCTIYDHADGIHYGLGYSTGLDLYYGIAADQEAVGEFGFDGKEFDLSTWMIGEQQFADLRMAGYVAPKQGTTDMEQWTGNMNTWSGGTGVVAVFTEDFQAYQNLWATEEYASLNLDIVPYPIPTVTGKSVSGAESEGQRTLAQMDFAGVSTSCNYQREAYELLKFMSFGVDGWKTRIQLYQEKPHLMAKDMSVPVTKDEAVWDAYINMYCADMDAEHKALWENYFESCMQPIPQGEVSIVGVADFRAYLEQVNLHRPVDSYIGKGSAEEYMEKTTAMANYYHAKAMVKYFGKEGYNVLEEYELAFYELMIVENEYKANQ